MIFLRVERRKRYRKIWAETMTAGAGAAENIKSVILKVICRSLGPETFQTAVRPEGRPEPGPAYAQASCKGST